MTLETVSSQIEIQAPVEEIMEILVDFPAYPEWARGVKSVRVVQQGEDGRPLDVEFEVQPGPLPKMRYVLRYAYAPDRLSWDYVEGDMRDLRGSYEFAPKDGATAVTYHLAIEPGTIRLPGFVKARAAREITRIALQELKKRVEVGR